MQKYRDLPSWFHITVIFGLGMLLIIFFLVPSILGSLNGFVVFLLAILIALEIFFGLPMTKRKNNFELNKPIKYQVKSYQEIKDALAEDFTYTRFNEDEIYFKIFNHTLVEIEFRNHFDQLKYEAKLENVEEKRPKFKKKIEIVIVPSKSKRARFFARFYGFMDADTCEVAYLYQNETLIQYTEVAFNRDLILKILASYFFVKSTPLKEKKDDSEARAEE